MRSASISDLVTLTPVSYSLAHDGPRIAHTQRIVPEARTRGEDPGSAGDRVVRRIGEGGEAVVEGEEPDGSVPVVGAVEAHRVATAGSVTARATRTPSPQRLCLTWTRLTAPHHGTTGQQNEARRPAFAEPHWVRREARRAG